MLGLAPASSASAGPVRATATTGAPASANATAMPRPNPRLAPTTIVVLLDKSLIIVLFPLLTRGFTWRAAVVPARRTGARAPWRRRRPSSARWTVTRDRGRCPPAL